MRIIEPVGGDAEKFLGGQCISDRIKQLQVVLDDEDFHALTIPRSGSSGCPGFTTVYLLPLEMKKICLSQQSVLIPSIG